jgi:hypothetical protein
LAKAFFFPDNSTKDMPMQIDKYQNSQEERYNSFVDWIKKKYNINITKSEHQRKYEDMFNSRYLYKYNERIYLLSRAGFYVDDELLLCAWCHLKLDYDKMYFDFPMLEHYNLAPDCDFVKKQCTQNANKIYQQIELVTQSCYDGVGGRNYAVAEQRDPYESNIKKKLQKDLFKIMNVI